MSFPILITTNHLFLILFFCGLLQYPSEAAIQDPSIVTSSSSSLSFCNFPQDNEVHDDETDDETISFLTGDQKGVSADLAEMSLSSLQKEKRSAHKGSFCSICLLCCLTPMLTVIGLLAALKHDNSFLKRGAPLGNYLRSHGWYGKMEEIETTIDYGLRAMFNDKDKSYLKWISDVGVAWGSDFTIDTCAQEDLNHQVSKFRDNDLIYIRHSKTACFSRLFFTQS